MIDSPPETLPEGDEARGERLVASYLTSKTKEAREAVLLNELSYVRSVVSKIPNPIPHLLSPEDLMQYGVIGLIAALERFTPNRGTKFRTWAYTRIRGAALDAIRRMSSNSRSRNVTFTTIDLVDPNVLEYRRVVEDVLPSSASESLKDAMARLPGRQAVVLILLVNGLKAQQVANILSISPSTVQKERARGVQSLREYLLQNMAETVEF